MSLSRPNPYESPQHLTYDSPPSPNDLTSNSSLTMSPAARRCILLAAFLGWMFSGVQMAVMTASSRSATTEFARSGQLTVDSIFAWSRFFSPAPTLTSPLTPEVEQAILKRAAPPWVAGYNAAFLLGAAAGGLIFGSLGDTIGRVRAMSLSVLCYSLFAGAGYFAQTPEQLLLFRILSGLGVGGTWPTGVSLASEAWADVSRPLLAGLLGASANVGIVLFNVVAYYKPVTAESWRWTLLMCSLPALVGVWSWLFVPESLSWLAARSQPATGKPGLSTWDVFRPPLLKLTLVGILVGTVPLFGGWGATQWLILWAEKVRPEDPSAKALTAIMRASGGTIGSLIGGWLASLLGRRLTYFLISLASLALGEYVCLYLTPRDYAFSAFVFALGFISTVFFGWLPLYLPELFPTHARALGSGVSFNFGRILTACGVLGAGWITAALQENYGRAGSYTMLIYAVGMIFILFAPDTTKPKPLPDQLK